MAQCTATAKQTRNRCKRHATPGMKTCRLHGGKTPSGQAHPGYKTGRYSKHLIGKLGEHYESARLDPELMSLREEVALFRGRLSSKIERLGEIDDPDNASAVWVDINAIVHKLQSLIESEQSRLLKAQQAINAEQLGVMINVVVDCIKNKGEAA